MINYILLAAASLLSCATAHAQSEIPWNVVVKEAIDAANVPELPNAAAGVTTPSDLTLDTSFFGTGMVPIYPPSTPPNATDIEDGLRVFQYRVCNPLCNHRGYYVVGRVKNTDGSWQSAVTRRNVDGTLDPTFGTAGWMYPSTHVTDVVDAAMGPGRIYILSTVDLGGVPVMRATCTELATGNNCFSGFGGIVSFGATSSGAIRSAYARRIVYDSRYGLFIAGRVWTVARGWEIAVARLDADTGALVTEFHGDGTTIGLPTYAAQTDSDIDVFDMTVVPAGTPGGERLYVAGTVKLDAVDSDGFVLGLNPTNGYTITGWSWLALYYEQDNTGVKKDAITAISVQHNGRLAMAGWTETDTPNERVTILSRALPNGFKDYDSFCSNGMAICNSPVPSLGGVVDDDFPVAIAERAGNRDLVVALKSRSRSGNYHPVQTVYQLNSGGTVVRTSQTLDFAAALPGSQWSRPFGMWVGNIAFSTHPANEVVVVTGTRLFDATDYDVTLSQMVATDSMFADQFGGPQGD